MTLGQLKTYAVKLIDEYSNNANITDDEDIKLKLNDLFNIAQLEMCQIRKIEKVFEFSVSEVVDKEYNTNNLPNDFMDLNKIRYFSVNGTPLNYYIQDKKIKTHKNCLGMFEVEYYAIPKFITQETDDAYQFELDIDAQMALPYYVASDILKSDVSANYTAFEAKYNAKLEILNSNKKGTDGLISINQVIGSL